MAIITGSFQWGAAKITVQKPNGFSRQRRWRLNQLLTEQGTEDIPAKDAAGIAFYLANTVSVEGNIGFPIVPVDPTHQELMGFIRGVGEADDDLIGLYDDAIAKLIGAGNDAALLPPQAVEEKKDETPTL